VTGLFVFLTAHDERPLNLGKFASLLFFARIFQKIGTHVIAGPGAPWQAL